eukprot:592801_1
MISLNEYSIHVSIAERYASVAYKFAFENTSDLNQSDELRFEMTIDPDAFISGFEASIDGELFIGKTKEKKQAKQEYVAAKEKNENAILITQPFPDIPNVFQVKTNIDSQSKIVLTIHIEQYLKKKLHFNALNIQIVKAFHKYNITQKCDHIQLNMDIADQRGIYDLQLPSNNKALIIDTNIFSETLHQIRAKVLKDSTLNELCLKYKVKGEQNESHVFYDKSSDTFVHQISDIISDSVVDEVGALDKTKHCIMIPRRVVFIIDKSGSMSGIKWTKTLLATVTALKQLRVDHDRYCLVFFDSQIELSSNIGMLLADSSNISQSIQYVEDQSTGGATNINAALLKGIELIKNDVKVVDKDDLFQNQMIFITDGEPNSGETDTNNIIGNVEAQNKLDGDDTKICIFCFGVGSDCNDSSWIHDLSHSFLKSLAVNNDGIYKRIKESTCDGQLNEYFDILSRPVLSNVRVEYDGMNEMDLTQHAFNTLYDGNDLIICGQLKHYKSLNMTANISAITGLKIKQQDGTAGIKRIKIRKQICINLGDGEQNTNNPNIERIWAYLKLQQLARQRLINDDMIEFDASDDDIPLRLAMRYKFVTPWTSMIVVKHKTEQSDDKETPEPDTMEDNKNDDDGVLRKAYNFDYSLLDQIGPRRKHGMNSHIISAAPPSFSAAISAAPPSFSYDSYHSCVQADDDWLNCPGLDSDDEMITLSSGGPNPVEFEVNRRDTEGSKFCTTIFEGDADATNIEIRQVEPNVLEMIVHYLKHYRDSSWNANEWIEGFDINALSDIVDGANYMDIQSLYNLAKCALDAKEKVLCQWIDDKMRNILMKTKTNVVMQMIDDLLFVFDDVSDISELKLQTFSAMNMVYLVRKILVDHCQYFGIHLDEHETDIICKYFEQTKVNGKVFVELVQSNSFVSNVKDFVSQINQNKQQISDPKLQTLQQHILSLVS